MSQNTSAEKRRGTLNGDAKSSPGDAPPSSGQENGAKERKDSKAGITQPPPVQPKRAPGGGGIIGALIKEAEGKGRHNLREVEDKRLSMVGMNNGQLDALKTALNEPKSAPPQVAPRAGSGINKPPPNVGNTNPAPKAGTGIRIRDLVNKNGNEKLPEATTNEKDKNNEAKENGKEKDNDKEKTNGGETTKSSSPAVPRRLTASSTGAAPPTVEEGKATFTKEEVQKYKEEMMRRYEEEEARQGRKKRAIPPGPGVGAPAPPPRKKAESSPVVTRKEEEGPATPEKMQRMRQSVMDELLQTEADYIRDLKIIYALYHNPLKTQAILEPQDFQSLFSNLSIILNVSQEVEAELVKIKDSGSQSVGKTFLKVADYLKMYTQYCANQEICVKTLDTLEKKNKQFAQFLDECALNPQSRGMSINAFLIKPIQRICKYPLLLKELMKYTPEDDPDYNDLKAALEKVSAVVNVVNKKKAETENLQMLLEIQGQIAGAQELHLIEPGRVFIMEATFNKVSDGKVQERHFFLFNDMLVYVSTNVFGSIKGAKETLMGRKKYVLKGHISFQKALIRDFEDEGAIRNAFDIIQLAGKKKVITLCCGTPEDKKLWMGEIEDKIENYLQKEMMKGKGDADDLTSSSANNNTPLSSSPSHIRAGPNATVNSPMTGPKKIGRTRTRLPTQVLDAVPLESAFEEMGKEERKGRRPPPGVMAPSKSLPLPPGQQQPPQQPPSPQGSTIGDGTHSPKQPGSPQGSGIGNIVGSGGSGIAGRKPPSPQGSEISQPPPQPQQPQQPQQPAPAFSSDPRKLQRTISLGDTGKEASLDSGNNNTPTTTTPTTTPTTRGTLQRSISEIPHGGKTAFDGARSSPLAASGVSPATLRKAAPAPPSKQTKPARQSIGVSAEPALFAITSTSPSNSPRDTSPQQPATPSPLDDGSNAAQEGDTTTTTTEPATTEETLTPAETTTIPSPTDTPATTKDPSPTHSPTNSPRSDNQEEPEGEDTTAPLQPATTNPIGGAKGVPAGRNPTPINNINNNNRGGGVAGVPRVSNFRKGPQNAIDALIQNQAMSMSPPAAGGDPQQGQQGATPAPGAAGGGYRSRVSYYSPTAIVDDAAGESTSSSRTTRTRPTRGRGGRGN